MNEKKIEVRGVIYMDKGAQNLLAVEVVMGGV